MSYSWNDRGEMTARSRTAPTIPIPSAQRIFQHGFEDGTQTITETLGFDQARRLVAFQGQVTHAYDAHNHRVRTVTPNWGTRYQIYSRSGELLYIEDSAVQERTEFYHLNGTLVAERTRPLASETATINYLHSDHRGTPTVKTSTAGTRTYRSRLMPYGAPYDGIYRDGPGFTKHATDEISSMNYMQQRYFDPTILGFVSPDPDGPSPESFGRYWYANNNPYTYVDPDGRCATVTGSRICGNSVAIAAVAKTALSAQTFGMSRVEFANGADPSNDKKKGETVVKDANRAGDMAMVNGDGRFITAFNRIENLVVDRRDFDKVAPGAIAFTTYGGNINFSMKYFARNSLERTKQFVHEAYHHDKDFYDLRMRNKPNCKGWDCADERQVDNAAKDFMIGRWKPEYFDKGAE